MASTGLHYDTGAGDLSRVPVKSKKSNRAMGGLLGSEEEEPRQRPTVIDAGPKPEAIHDYLLTTAVGSVVALEGVGSGR